MDTIRQAREVSHFVFYNGLVVWTDAVEIRLSYPIAACAFALSEAIPSLEQR